MQGRGGGGMAADCENFREVIPTPRPDRLVMVAAVENPGSKMSCSTSWSLSAAPAVISPCSSALARTRSRLMPRPSSFTVMTTSAPAWKADSVIRPFAGLPAARRSAEVSSP